MGAGAPLMMQMQQAAAIQKNVVKEWRQLTRLSDREYHLSFLSKAKGL